MKFKNFIILVLFLLFCGCSAKYEINFIDNEISENLTVTYPRNKETDYDLIRIYSDAFYSIERDEFYKFTNKSTNEDVGINLAYDYNVNNITSSNMIRSCIEHFDFFKEDGKYFLTASGGFRCSYYEYVELDSFDIIITTNHNVLDNNADEVDDDSYIWHVNLDKINDLSIKFITDDKENPKIKQREYMQVFMIIGCIAILFVIIAVVISIRHKKVNKI